jgi:arthrofactin-type cyclic lipopeptide synthetase B
VPRVGRHDSFFDLGGHSLLAIGMVERLRQDGWELDLASVFAEPTLQALAAACTPLDEADDRADAPQPMPEGLQRLSPQLLPASLVLTQAQLDAIAAQVPGGAANIQDLCPLGPLQQGMLFHRLRHHEGDPFAAPIVLALAIARAGATLGRAVGALVQRHDILRTSFVWQGLAQPVQVVWRRRPLQAQWLDGRSRPWSPWRSCRSGWTAPTSACRWTGPGDAGAGRGRPRPGAVLLGLSLHHLLLDHRSVGLLMHELAATRPAERTPTPAGAAAAARGGLAPGPPADRSAVAAAGGLLSQRAGRPGHAHHPLRPGWTGQHRPADAARAPPALPEPLAAALRQRARSLDVSLSALLHLAWALVLARCSDRDDVAFGTVLLGRSRPGLTQAMGMLINTLPLRVHFSHKTVAKPPVPCKSSLAGLLRHDQAPLALAQRCSGVAAPAPLFTALFNHRQHSREHPGLLPGAELVWAQERTGYPLALAVDDDGSSLALTVQAAAPADAQR